MNRAVIVTLALILSASSAVSATDHWPQFRGPQGGVADDDPALPDRWSETENVAWKVDIPGLGWSSPIVWGDHVFVTTAVSSGTETAPVKGLFDPIGDHSRNRSPAAHRWMLFDLDFTSGKVRWQRELHSAPPPTAKQMKNSYASETPVTDGERVYVYFGAIGLVAAIDFNGKPLWTKQLAAVEGRQAWGTAASPLVYKDRLYIVNDNRMQSFIAAFDTNTGQEIWRIDREEVENWSSPIVWENDRRAEIVTAGEGKVRSYSLDGTLLWELGGMSLSTIPTPFVRHGPRRTILLCAGWLAMAAAVNLSAQTLAFTPVGSIAGPVDMIKVDGSRAYFSAGKTLTVVDISNPAIPKRGGTYTFPELIWGFTVVGSTVYVATDLYGLGILDVSNVASPALRGAFKTPGQAKNVALFGTKALVADHVAGIDVIDVSSVTKPTLAGSFFVDGFAKDVVIRGTLAYALNQPTGLSVFDLTRPGTFEPSATVTLANPIALRAQLAVSEETSSGGPRVALVMGGGPIQIFDLANRQSPVRATIYRTPGVAQRVSLQGTRAYVADGPAGLQVLDLSTPSKPAIVGAYKTPMPARDVAAAGSLVFVVVGAEEVLILRQDP